MVSRLLGSHTWQIEAGVVAFVLLAVFVTTGAAWKELIGSAAVFVTFMHAQVADRMAEQQKQMTTPSVECWPWLQRYYVTKEVLWLVYFALSQTWAALAGVFVFLLYPLWRRHYLGKYSHD